MLRQAAAHQPVDPGAYEALAAAAERASLLPEAKDALERLVTLARDEAAESALAARIAGLALRLHDPAEAVRWLERAVLAAPDDTTLLPRLAEAELAEGSPERARETVQRAAAAGVYSPLLQEVSLQLDKRRR